MHTVEASTLFRGTIAAPPLWSVYRAQARRVTETAASHDIVVVGASAGGVRALRKLVAGLPADFRGSVFVVLHVPPHLPSGLADILARSGVLPAAPAEDGDPIERGRIYVAQPNRHLVVRHGRVKLEIGPRENSARASPTYPRVRAHSRSVQSGKGAGDRPKVSQPIHPPDTPRMSPVRRAPSAPTQHPG